MRRTAAVVILILPLLMTGLAIAESFEDAKKAYEHGDYITAYRLIKPLAEQGNPDAQLMLGFMYDQGQGVPQDFAQMEKWYRRAAKQGSIAAQSTLRLMEERGEMEKWHRAETEPRNAADPPNLGLMEERSEKEKWHRGAAEPRNAAAQPNLGLMEEIGRAHV